MKKSKTIFTAFVCLLLALTLSLSLVGCNDDPTTDDSSNNTASSPCTEKDIRMLMEKNLDCVYCFFICDVIHPISDSKPDSNGYYEADTSLFKTYSEFEEYIRSVYNDTRATELLTSYPKKDTPVYKKDGDVLMVNPDVYTPEDYTITWEDYTVTIITSNIKKCTFELATTSYEDNNPIEYTVQGSATNENGVWLLDEITY